MNAESCTLVEVLLRGAKTKSETWLCGKFELRTQNPQRKRTTVKSKVKGKKSVMRLDDLSPFDDRGAAFMQAHKHAGRMFKECNA